MFAADEGHGHDVGFLLRSRWQGQRRRWWRRLLISRRFHALGRASRNRRSSRMLLIHALPCGIPVSAFEIGQGLGVTQ